MQLKCPSCTAQIKSDDINLERMIAKCSNCDALMSIASHLGQSTRSATRAASRTNVPIPERFHIDDGVGHCSISWRWFSPAFFFLLLFSIPWIVLVVVFVTPHGDQPTPWFVYPFMLPFAALGFGLAYLSLAGLLNRTTVRIDFDRLTVRHGPVPWIGNLSVPIHEIDQIYCKAKKRISHSKNGSTSTHCTYAVHFLDKQNRSRYLISALDDMEQVLYLEQLIEQRLRLEDRAVNGEFRPQSGSVETVPAAVEFATPDRQPLFLYKAMNNLGEEIQSQIAADSERDAREQLRQMGYFVTSLRRSGD